MENLLLLSEEETVLVNAGGFWYDAGVFLAAWHNFITTQQSQGSSGMEFMGGA